MRHWVVNTHPAYGARESAYGAREGSGEWLASRGALSLNVTLVSLRICLLNGAGAALYFACTLPRPIRSSIG